jgi:hypothetical protein
MSRMPFVSRIARPCYLASSPPAARVSGNDSEREREIWRDRDYIYRERADLPANDDRQIERAVEGELSGCLSVQRDAQLRSEQMLRRNRRPRRLRATQTLALTWTLKSLSYSRAWRRTTYRTALLHERSCSLMHSTALECPHG